MYASYELAVSRLGGEEAIQRTYGSDVPSELKEAVETELGAVAAEIDSYLSQQITTPATVATTSQEFIDLLATIEVVLYFWGRVSTGATKPPSGLKAQAAHYREMLGQWRDGDLPVPTGSAAATAEPWVDTAGEEKTNLTATLFQTWRTMDAWPA